MEKKDIKNGKKHLPLYGIGPALTVFIKRRRQTYMELIFPKI